MDSEWKLWAVTALLVLAMFGCSAAVYGGTKEVQQLTVGEKWTKRSGKTEQYLVETDKGVYSVDDNWWALQFRASDTYAGLEAGTKVCAATSGYRFGLTSGYPNIDSLLPAKACR